MEIKAKHKKTVVAGALLGLAALALYSAPGMVKSVLSFSREENRTVVIDAGHGGDDPGKVGINGALEKDINLEIALLVESYLKQNDVKVVLTRNEDKGLYQDGSTNKKIEDLKNRMALIESAGALLAVSIHQNSYTTEAVHGAQVFYYETSEQGRYAAQLMQKSLTRGVDSSNNRVEKSNKSYYLLKKSSVPTIIVECGFLSNSEEAERLTQKEYQQRLAWSIAMGILQYLSNNRRNTDLETVWIKDLEKKPDDAAIRKAGEIIKGGGLVAFPTETVYGLGGDALNPASSKKIYAAKGRPSDNPLIVHICRMEDLERIALKIPPAAKILAEKFWPGPLTMIFQKKDIVPDETTGGLATVAVRFPDHEVAKKLIDAAGGFVAAPSANSSGRPSPTLGKYVYEDLNTKIEMILDSGQVGIGLESTIVDVTSDPPMILRPGYVTREMLGEALGEIESDPTLFETKEGQAPKAPGMKYRHYAPKGELTIVAGTDEQVCGYIQKALTGKRRQGFRTGVILARDDGAPYEADSVKRTGGRGQKEQLAQDLFRFLREFDEEGIEFIYAASVSEDGIGQAVMNRLLKAAGHRIVDAESGRLM